MYPTHTIPLASSKRVRTLWSDFESWVDVQRKTLDRRREEISKAQDLKWKTVLAKTHVRQDEHDSQKAKLLREALDDHLSRIRVEWQTRLAKHNLRDEDWGQMTFQELQRVEKVLGGESDEQPHTPATQNVVVTQPQRVSPPVSNPAPPLSSAARVANVSTTSSYTLVSVNEFSTDDELYEAVSSYIVPTDESEDDEHVSIPVPITHRDGWGMANNWTPNARSSNHSSNTGSPDQPSASSSGAHDYFSQTPASSRPDINSAPPKRPPDLDRKSGKTRVRGPTYVGPRLSNPEESSEEEDFELFKMQTRVAKIFEFHLDAARAGAELAMAIQNDRRTKKSSGKADDAAKVAAHEKQMLKLQAEKEEERKVIVATERKKRRDEIRKRSVLGDPARAANTAPASVTPQDWEGTLKKGQTIRLDTENKLFVIGKEEAAQPDENQAWGSPQFESASDLRTPTLPGSSDTLRARKQTLGRGVTPSGWKTTQSTSTPTTSLSQWPAEAPAASSPDPSAIPSWMEAAFKDTSLDYSSSFESDDSTFQPHGGFPTGLTSTPVPPIPSGWGPKKSGQTATSLLKKVLADPTPTPLPALANKNKNTPSPPTEAPSKATAPEHKSAPIAAKKPTKKGRQVIQKKGAGSSKVEDDAAGSPTTPTLTAAKFAVSPKDILQQRFVQTDDELSSTPRPQFSMNAKRGAGSMADSYMSDFVTTPKASMRRLGEMAGTGPSPSALGASSWTMEREQEQEETPWERAARLKMGGAPPQRAPEVRSGWGRATMMRNEEEEDEEEEEESPWAAMERMKGRAQVPMSKPAEKTPEENPWLRMQRMNGQAQATSSRLAEEVPEQSPWDRMQRLKEQAQGVLSSTRSTLAEEESEESPWERMQRMKAQGQALPPKPVQTMREDNSWGRGMQASQMADPRSSTSKRSPPSQEEGSLWERQVKPKSQSAFSQRTAPAPAASLKNTVEEESIWNQVMKGNQPPIGDHQASMMMSMSQTVPKQPSEPEETPWQRFARLQVQKGAPDVDSTANPSVSAKMHSSKISWGGPMDYDSPLSKPAQQQPPPPPQAQSANLYWTPNGGGNQSQMWDAAPAGAMKNGAKAKKAGTKRVTIEEVPDEDGPSGRKGPEARLPSNSRILLDIVEPKPSVPSTMFTNIFQYGEEEDEEEEYDTGLSSMVPTPSTAPTSPPGEVPSLDDEEWLMSAAENAKNGNWDSLLNGGGSLGPEVHSKIKQVPGGWPSESPTKRDAAGFQMVDSAKLYSALESVEPAAAPAPKAAPAPPAPAPAPAASKVAPTVPKTAPAVVEKPEPAAKPGNQNQTKGKGKGKGKGRK
ncbi:hypothetical protein FPV67DRAFT_1494129 [Lyophyllum atratum]|nr:hypothetical protein FPV67DRAFT_1494129 [Lyophyllum atratum]